MQPLRSIEEEAAATGFTPELAHHSRAHSLCPRQHDAEEEEEDEMKKGSRVACHRWRSIQEPDVAAQLCYSVSSPLASLWSVSSNRVWRQQVGPQEAGRKQPLVGSLASWHQRRRHLFMGATMDRRRWEPVQSSQGAGMQPASAGGVKLSSRQPAPGGVMVVGPAYSCLPDKQRMAGESKERWQGADMETTTTTNDAELVTRRKGSAAAVVCVVTARADGAGNSSCGLQLKGGPLMEQQQAAARRGLSQPRRVLNLNLAQQVCGATAPPSLPASLLMCSTTRATTSHQCSNHRLATRRAERSLMVCSSIPARGTTTKRSLSYHHHHHHHHHGGRLAGCKLSSCSRLGDLESSSARADELPLLVSEGGGGRGALRKHPSSSFQHRPTTLQPPATATATTTRASSTREGAATFQQRTRSQQHHVYHHYHHHHHHHHHNRRRLLAGRSGSAYTNRLLLPVRLRQAPTIGPRRPAASGGRLVSTAPHKRLTGGSLATVTTTATKPTTAATTNTTTIKPAPELEQEQEEAGSVDERQQQVAAVCLAAANTGLASQQLQQAARSSWGGADDQHHCNHDHDDPDDDDSQPAPPSNVHPLEVLTQDSLLAISIYDPLPPIRRRPSLASSTEGCTERRQQPALALGAQGQALAAESEPPPPPPKPDEDQEQLLLRDLFPLELRKPLSWPSPASCCRQPAPPPTSGGCGEPAASGMFELSIEREGVECEPLRLDSGWSRDQLIERIHQRLLWIQRRLQGGRKSQQEPEMAGGGGQLRSEAARMLELCLEGARLGESRATPDPTAMSRADRARWADRAQAPSPASRRHTTFASVTAKSLATGAASHLASQHESGAQQEESGQRSAEGAPGEEQEGVSPGNLDKRRPASVRRAARASPEVCGGPKRHATQECGSGASLPDSIHSGCESPAPREQPVAQSRQPALYQLQHQHQQHQLQLQLQLQSAAQRQRRKRRQQQQQQQQQVAHQPPADSSSGNRRLAMSGSPAPESRLWPAAATGSCATAGKLAATNRNNTNASASRSGAAGSPALEAGGSGEAVEAVGEPVGVAVVGVASGASGASVAASAVGGAASCCEPAAAPAIEGSPGSRAVEPEPELELELELAEPKAAASLDLGSQPQQASQYEQEDVYLRSRLASGCKPAAVEASGSASASASCWGCGCAQRSPTSIGLVQEQQRQKQQRPEQPTSSGAVGRTSQNTIGCPDNISLFSQNGLRVCTCRNFTASPTEKHQQGPHSPPATSIISARHEEAASEAAEEESKLVLDKQQQQQVARNVTRPPPSADHSAVGKPTICNSPVQATTNIEQTLEQPPQRPQLHPDTNKVSNKPSGQMSGEQAPTAASSGPVPTNAGDHQHHTKQPPQTDADMEQQQQQQQVDLPDTKVPEQQPVPQAEQPEAGAEQVHPQPQPRANNRSILILREIGPQAEESAVRDIFNSENCQSKPVHCEYALHNSWYVHFKDDEDAKLALAYIRKYIVAWQGQPIMARYKPKPAGPSNASNQPPPTHTHHVPPLVIHQQQQQEAASSLVQPAAILAGGAPQTITGVPQNPVLPLAAAQATPAAAGLSPQPPLPNQAYQQPPVNGPPMMHQPPHHLLPQQHQPPPPLPHHHGYGYSAVAYYGQQGPVLTPWHYSNTQYDFSEVFIYNGLTPYPAPAPAPAPVPGLGPQQSANNKNNNSHNKVLSQNTAPTMAAVSGAALLGGTDSGSLAYHHQHHHPHQHPHQHHHSHQHQQQHHHHHNAQHHPHHHNNSHSHSHHTHNSHHHHHHHNNNNNHHHHHGHSHHHHTNNHHLNHNTGVANMSTNSGPMNQSSRGNNSGATGGTPSQPATGATAPPSNDNNNTNNSTPTQPLTNQTTKPPLANQKPGHQKCPNDNNNNNTNLRHTNGFSSVNNNGNSNQQLGNMSPTATTTCQPTSITSSTVTSQANSATKRSKNPVTNSNNSSNRNASANKV